VATRRVRSNRELPALQEGERAVCCISPVAVVKANCGGVHFALSAER